MGEVPREREDSGGSGWRVGGEGEKELVLGRSRCGEGAAPVLGRGHDLRPQLLLLPGQGWGHGA